MKFIVFAGGTGKRFWPASRKSAPKQFMNVIGDKPLVKQRIDLLLKSFPAEDIFLSTGKQYEKEVREILSELPAENFILEPEMRDTGPAVALAVSHIYHKFGNVPTSIQWSDHQIKDSEVFIETLKHAENLLLEKEKDKIIFISVPARFPSPHRGYIHFDKEINLFPHNISLRKFIEFNEKPTVEVAKQYMESGFYGWNPGYWNLNPETYLNILKTSDPKCYEVCKEIAESNFSQEALTKFTTIEKISADYQVAEYVKPEEALVLYAELGWSDVGEWIALKETLQSSDESIVTFGNVIDLDSKDSIIYNYDDSKLVSTINLEGMVIVNTKDAVAIFKKEDNTKLKEYLKKLEDQGYSQYL